MHLNSSGALLKDFATATVAVGVTAIQLANVATKLQHGIAVKADINNTGTIYVGKSTATAASATLATAAATDGYQLGPGHELFLPIDVANTAYAIASAAGQRVSILYI